MAVWKHETCLVLDLLPSELSAGLVRQRQNRDMSSLERLAPFDRVDHFLMKLFWLLPAETKASR